MSDKDNPIPRQTTDHGKIEKTRKELEKNDRPEERDLTTDHDIGDHEIGDRDIGDDRRSMDDQVTPPVRTD